MSPKDDSHDELTQVEQELSSWKTLRPSPGTGERVLGPAFSALAIDREPFSESEPARKKVKMSGLKRVPLPIALKNGFFRIARGFAIFSCLVIGLRFSVQFLGTCGLITTMEDLENSAKNIQAQAKVSEFSAQRAECDQVLRSYTAALLLIPAKKMNQNKVPDLTSDKSAAAEEKTRLLLNEYESTLSIVEKLSSRDYDLTKGDIPPHDHTKVESRYGIKYGNHFRKTRYVARLLSAKAKLAAKEKRSTVAWRQVSAGLRLREFIGADRILINEMVSQNHVRQAAETAKHLIDVGKVYSHQEFVRAMSILKEYDPIESVRMALIGESKFCTIYLKKIISFDKELPDDNLLFNLSINSFIGQMVIWLGKPLLINDIGYYQSMITNIIAVFNESKDVNTLRQNLQAQDNKIPFYYPLTAVASPNYKAVMKRTLRTRALVDIALIKMANELRRRNNGHLFTSLKEIPEELLPKERTIDPFSGKPYVYSVTEGKLKIYSVGTNGIDNGGNGDDLK